MRYVAKQLLNMAVTLLVVSFLVFALNELTPIDVARKLLGPYATQDQVDVLYRQMGLDRPLIVRYWEFLSNALRGDFGESLALSSTGRRSRSGTGLATRCCWPPSASQPSFLSRCCSA